MVDLKELDELTPEDIRHLTSRPSLETPSDRVGKLMTDHNWYYAVIIESQDADRYLFRINLPAKDISDILINHSNRAENPFFPHVD